MQLIFEKSVEGRYCSLLPDCDVKTVRPSRTRKTFPELPQLSENDISRHYTELAGRTHGVNNGFYPLGSCTMKYNPKINDEVASLEAFEGIHPLQPERTARGCMEVLSLASEYLCEITGMDTMTFQPAAGAHGEFTGVCLIKAYHRSRGDVKRTKMIVPDSAHGTNPATAAMAGCEVINLPSGADGCVDLDKLRASVGEDTAGLMLTNPNTVGLFDRNIKEITKIVHDAGGLVYYDGANLNAVMGIVRPGDMGYDVVHLNLHKTFSTPHGGGGPGAGAVGCKEFLSKFLPNPQIDKNGNFVFSPESIGKVKAFYGNFLVVVKALCYILSIGRKGIPEAAENAVLNANYLMKLLSEKYTPAFDRICMHEFVLTLQPLKEKYGVSAMDVAKSLLDYKMHPPTMYFPLIVHEALMLEPTETESKETLDKAAEIFGKIYDDMLSDPEKLRSAPHTTPVGRPDDVLAARQPVLRYKFER